MLDQRCDELIASVEASNALELEEKIQQLWQAAQDAAPQELTGALRRISEVFDLLPLGPGSRLAILAGALVERGADPDGLAAPIMVGLRRCLRVANELITTWQHVVGDEEPPMPVDDQEAFNSMITALLQPGSAPDSDSTDATTRLSPEQAYRLTEGWFALNGWAMSAMTLLQSRQVRTQLSIRHELLELMKTVEPVRPDLEFLTRLLLVLDDERLVVLHRQTGRGYQVTISGIGDNFQLHTLLAATLSGPASDGLLEDIHVDPAWVAAATDGPLEPPNGPIEGQFNLVDAWGKWIWNEGVPADIPLLDGQRVVVLDPPPYPRSWNIGRVYLMMRPEVRLDRILSPEEAAAWLSRVADQ